MFRILTLLISAALLFSSQGIAQDSDSQAKLAGKILEASTGKTIPGAHVTFLNIDKGTVSDANGEFQFTDIPAGVYSINVSFVGFRDRTVTDIVVGNNRTTRVTVELEEGVIQGEGVTVTGGYFNRSDTEIVSRKSLNNEEIRRSPGAGQELSRVITTTAGVASTGETSQDLMVRGGSPRENGFYIDNIFIPGIQHFEQMDGSSNGPIGLINTELVKTLDFYAGGFSAKYGGKMSSMGDITYREPSRDQLQGNVNMNLAGFGGLVEGPGGENSRWLVSARRSYLDLISDAINAGGAPRYGDIQAKGVIDINDQNKLTILQLFGDSEFRNPVGDAREDGLLSHTHFKNNQNTTGVNWRRFWQENLYTNTSLSYSFTEHELDSDYVTSEETHLNYNNRYDYLNARSSSYWRISDPVRLEFGMDATYTEGNFDYYYAPSTNEAGVEQPEVTRSLDKEQLTGELFGTLILKPTDAITFNAGSRIGFNNLNNDLSLSPRLAGSWELNPRFTLNASAGIYRQNLPLYIRSQQPEFDNLEDPYATHLIGGFDYLLGKATMLTVEVYDKRYRDLPIQPGGYQQGHPSFVFETQTFFDDLEDHGKAYARGIDFMAHRKIKEGIYGTISASLFRTRYKDFEGDWQNRDYDVKYLLSAVGGYRPNDKWEFSARWTYMGSRPYTPVDKMRSAQINQTILDGSKYNEERLPAFHSIYLRSDRRFFLDQFTIVTFFELWNAYNRQNVEEVYWNRNTNNVDEINQFDLLPVGGFSIEF